METETVELSQGEVADQLGRLHEGLEEIVDAHLKNGDNPGVRVAPYAKGTYGRTHWTIGIEGLLTGPTIEWCEALKELAPGAYFRNENGPDGRSLGFKVHLPIVKTKQVPIQGAGGRRRHFVARPTMMRETVAQPPTTEWVALLLCATSAVGGLLYYRISAGMLY